MKNMSVKSKHYLKRLCVVSLHEFHIHILVERHHHSKKDTICLLSGDFLYIAKCFWFSEVHSGESVTRVLQSKRQMCG